MYRVLCTYVFLFACTIRIECPCQTGSRLVYAWNAFVHIFIVNACRTFLLILRLFPPYMHIFLQLFQTFYSSFSAILKFTERIPFSGSSLSEQVKHKNRIIYNLPFLCIRIHLRNIIGHIGSGSGIWSTTGPVKGNNYKRSWSLRNRLNLSPAYNDLPDCLWGPIVIGSQ